MKTNLSNQIHLIKLKTPHKLNLQEYKLKKPQLLVYKKLTTSLLFKELTYNRTVTIKVNKFLLQSINNTLKSMVLEFTCFLPLYGNLVYYSYYLL